MPRKKATNPKTKHNNGAKNKKSGASPLEILLAKSRKQKKVLTQSDIVDALPDGGIDLEATDALISQLVEHGIEVVEDEEGETEALADVDEPDDAELKEVELLSFQDHI